METGFDVTFCMKAHGCTITHDKENTQTSGCLEYNVAWLELTWENGVLVKKFFSNFTVVGDPGRGPLDSIAIASLAHSAFLSLLFLYRLLLPTVAHVTH